jgi:hypothetical protein
MTGASGASPSPPLCGHCGGPNPPGSRSCQWCHATLPLESSGYRSLAPITLPEPEPKEFPWVVVALVLLAVFGLAVLLVFIMITS